jgi:serine protease AprX
MNRKSVFTCAAIYSMTAGIAFFASSDTLREEAPAPEATSSFIVQGGSLESIAAIVQSVGGDITHELGVIKAVGADLTAAEVSSLRAHPEVRRLYSNESVEVAGKPVKDDGGAAPGGALTDTDTHYASRVNANGLHSQGIDGTGIGIAVLDTGLWKHAGIKYDRFGDVRLEAVYNAITDTVANSPISGGDPGGHGTHIASIAVSSLVTADGFYNGVAPGAHLISVQAFDELGQGTYADVVRAIDWVITNQAKHKIRVLNLSFSAEPRSHYWDDPINQAVMVAWQNEIFVVAAAGNRGPQSMTIGVPGNVPYVMTVGALSDNYTPADGSDDILASFSSAGPTHEGFVKPDVVAPGGHMLGLMQGNSMLATTYPEFYVDSTYFSMSGTSQATAVVSGIAALVLQAEPWRSVDELKCKIMSAAKPAFTGKGQNIQLVYSVFQQGAGLVDAAAAVSNSTVDCANNGLHIDNDIDGYQHFGGYANQQDDGRMYRLRPVPSPLPGRLHRYGGQVSGCKRMAMVETAARRIRGGFDFR